MNTLINYSLTVSILLTALFLIYQLLLRNNSFFKWRKATLFGLLVASFIAPLITIEAPKTMSENIRHLAPITQIIKEPLELRAEPSQPVQDNIDEYASNPWSNIGWLSVIFLTGCILSLGLLIHELIKGFQIIRHTKAERVNFSEKVKTPFSLFHKVFLPLELQESGIQRDVIIAHEKFHCKHYHTLELVLIRLIQSIIWYNPVAYMYLREVKLLHEASADQYVSQFYGEQTYLETLLSVKLSAFDISLQNSFNSQLYRRIKLIKTAPSHKLKTRLFFGLFGLIAISIFGLNVLKGQITVKREEDANNSITQKRTFFINVFLSDELSTKHTTIYTKLQELHPFDDLLVSYKTSVAQVRYEGIMDAVNKPLYIGKLNRQEKLEVYNKTLLNRQRLESFKVPGFGRSIDQWVSLNDMKDSIRRYMMDTDLYVVLFKIEEFGSQIYSYSEVDIKPEPIGGIAAFERSIALDISLPDHIKKEKLPKDITFEGIVDAHSLSALDLITELEGPENETLPYFRFFGSILKDINDKSRTIYKWTRGIKDGKEVKTRVQIKIPTAYFN
jgi:beta-lactamase regulating signal transducer with metallopeptidase domain